jgi:hypothetical protein
MKWPPCPTLRTLLLCISAKICFSGYCQKKMSCRMSKTILLWAADAWIVLNMFHKQTNVPWISPLFNSNDLCFSKRAGETTAASSGCPTVPHLLRWSLPLKLWNPHRVTNSVDPNCFWFMFWLQHVTTILEMITITSWRGMPEFAGMTT